MAKSNNEPLHPESQRMLETLVKLHGPKKLISAINTIAARLGIKRLMGERMANPWI